MYQDLEVKACQRLDGIYQYQAEVGKEALNQAKEMLGSLDVRTIGDTLSKADKLLEQSAAVLAKYSLE